MVRISVQANDLTVAIVWVSKHIIHKEIHMNRRVLIGSGIASATLLSRAFAQTPQATPVVESPDLRAREIVNMLESIRPLALLEALETATIANPDLLEAAGGAMPTAMPWQDFSDTDLNNSLGGVFITKDGAPLDSPDTELIGGYIVYESAEIAYHEVIRKLGPAYGDSVNTRSFGGTNHWILGSDELEISVGRIGYVMLMGLFSQYPLSPEGLIGHLHDVAVSLAR